MCAQERCPEWVGAQLDLRRTMSEWIGSSLAEQRHIPFRGGKRGHDEGSFTASWAGFYQLTGERRILEFMRSLRDQHLAYSGQHQVHGYDDWGEVHHQTEHYMIFLARLWQLDKTDKLTIAAIEDAAHHAGNWVQGVPPWYDWDAHQFRSWSLGTRLVQSYPPYDFEVPDHFKVIQMVYLAYLSTGKQRYLDLCTDYASVWANQILSAEAERPPAIRLHREGLSREELDVLYKGAPVRVAHLCFDASRVERTELFLASGALELFLDLWACTGEEPYLAAVQKLLPPVVDAVSDPDAEMPAMLLAKYRQQTGDHSWDAQLMERLQQLPRHALESMVMLVGVGDENNPIVGHMGRRKDQVRWAYSLGEGLLTMEDGASPTALMLAYQVSGDDAWATQALAKAARRMHLAAFTLRDGREHGCAAHTVHAVAAGHGRGTGAGCVTTTLCPFALGSERYAGAERPLISLFAPDGSMGVPEAVALRCVRRSDVRIDLELHNVSEEVVSGAVALYDQEERTPFSVPEQGSARLTLLVK